MRGNIAHSETISFDIKLKAFFALLKFRLSFLVSFSAGMAYMLANQGGLDWSRFGIFILGGFMATAAANIINQVWEVEYDKLMKRTMNRPLPTGKISVSEAVIFGTVLGIVGLTLLLVYINLFTFVLTFISVLLYGFAYTPLKRVGPIAVLVGAFPGALPVLIGWVAVRNQIDNMALIIFMIQFMWQFPHFWAIAWVADEDYKAAGFKLLPGGGAKNLKTAFTIMMYTLPLIPLGMLPFFLGETGKTSAIIVTLAGTAFLFQTFYLMNTCSRKAALLLMFGSFLYLPIVQIAFVML